MAANPAIHTLVSLHSKEFDFGFQQGLARKFRNIQLGTIVTEEEVVEVVRNLTEVAVEGWLTEEQLLRDCGILAGWIIRCIEAGR